MKIRLDKSLWECKSTTMLQYKIKSMYNTFFMTGILLIMMYVIGYSKIREYILLIYGISLTWRGVMAHISKKQYLKEQEK